MNICFQSLLRPKLTEDKRKKLKGRTGSAQPQDGESLSSLRCRRSEVAVASVGYPPPSTSAKDSAEPPLFLVVEAGIDGPAVSLASAGRSQVAGHEPPISKVWWAGQSRRNWLSRGKDAEGERLGRWHPGLAKWNKGSRKPWARRLLLACVLAGDLLPKSPGLAIPGRGLLCRRKGKGKGHRGCGTRIDGPMYTVLGLAHERDKTLF